MKTTKAIVLAMALVTMITACNNDLFDGYQRDESKTKYEAGWTAKFGEADSCQDWNCARRAMVNVTIADEKAGNYDLVVYDKSPVSPDASILARKSINISGNNVHTEVLQFDIEKADTTAYVMKADSRGYYSYVIADIVDGIANAQFGGGDVQFSDDDVQGKPASRASRASEYPSSVPNDAVKFTGDNCDIHENNTAWKSNVWIDNAVVSNMNFWVGGKNIYVTGNVSFTGSVYLGSNTNIYVMPGAKLTVNNEVYIQNWCELYVCQGAEADFGNKLTIATAYGLHNAGTIHAQSFGVNVNWLTGINNDGTLNVDGDFYITSNSNKFVNNGTVTAGTIVLTSDATFETTSGHTTSAYEIQANGCLLKIGEHAYLGCENFNMVNTRVELSQDALFSVTGVAEIGWNHTHLISKDDGFYSDSGKNKYAVVEFENVTFTNGNVRFSGNMYIDVENINNENMIKTSNGAVVSQNANGYTIENIYPDGSSYNGSGAGPATPPTPTVKTWILACEDLGSYGDYDFNDVVISISYASGDKTATITPLAAGGTYNAYINFNGKELGGSKATSEIHTLVGGTTASTSGSNKMYNTGTHAGETLPLSAAHVYNVEVPDNFTISYDAASGMSIAGFTLVVEKGSGTHQETHLITGPEVGAAPQVLILPGNWRWPREWQKIEQAYRNFATWAVHSTDNNNWWSDNVDESLIFSR